MKLNYRFFIFLFVLIFSLFFLVLKTIDFSLKKYTRHHSIIYVPSLVGLSLPEAKDTLDKYNLQCIVLDSAAYDPSYHRGTIVLHTPKANSEVKPGRKVYLTINPLTIQYVSLPDLNNKSLRQGISLLENHAFRIGDLHYVDYFAKDLIRFTKSDSNIVQKGDTLPKFSIIDLYVGDGFSKTVIVPDVVGLKYQQIKKKLNNYSLNLGEVEIDTIVLDTMNAFVHEQKPVSNEKVPIGSYVSITIKESRN